MRLDLCKHGDALALIQTCPCCPQRIMGDEDVVGVVADRPDARLAIVHRWCVSDWHWRDSSRDDPYFILNYRMLCVVLMVELVTAEPAPADFWALLGWERHEGAER